LAEGRWDTVQDLVDAKKVQQKVKKKLIQRPPSKEKLYKMAQYAVKQVLEDYKQHSDDELHQVATETLGEEYRWLKYRVVNSVVLIKNAPNPLYELDDKGGKLYWTKQHQ